MKCIKRVTKLIINHANKDLKNKMPDAFEFTNDKMKLIAAEFSEILFEMRKSGETETNCKCNCATMFHAFINSISSVFSLSFDRKNAKVHFCKLKDCELIEKK